MNEDYQALGLIAGIEIHQQLNTKEKLFCRCPTTIREAEESNGEFFRYLRATKSEMGELDRAAEEEMMQVRQFRYLTYDTTCLVENDEEPPAPLNEEALDIVLTIAKVCGMTPVPEIHTMRKLVIDGSNTSGFQRTALVAMNGTLPGGAGIETVCLEEEAAQRIEDTFFSLDRLGIPLIEITTSPCMHTPEAVQETAAQIGMILRSTGKVKRGLGTIRQDINISIREGARVEIKGVQELDLIAEVVRREVCRQVSLLDIRDELKKRGASVEKNPVDVTSLFTGSKSRVLKSAPKILAIRLNKFAGLVGREIQPGRRLGSEMSDYAKKCGVGGLFHTDELPAYGVTEDEVTNLKKALDATPDDCVIIVADKPQRCQCAMQQIIRRAEMAFEGVPKETRKMLEGGSTAYMRPLPGAARMYPETDVFQVRVTPERFASLEIPEMIDDTIARYMQEFGLAREVARQMAYSERRSAFEEAIHSGIKPALAERAFNSTLRELSREGAQVHRIKDEDILQVLILINSGEVAKEALSPILTALAEGKTPAEACERAAPKVSEEELTKIINRIVAERADFIKERGNAATGPVMGVVMKEVRGSVDGKIVNQILREAISQVLKNA
ncbi:Glu-tRNA(Gln) amidotransferase subunit GatE [Methanospirillum hungatei]|jgi:glutamyl-tRNA(Gln) amidotransferase subunit E|uniref:Glu-tRNA(Gln) amidotransferase subunit GatE n=1 Tax=Methanospirillum hungatei TaxID=2203 RepID=UPI001B650235|nr:Glu-tRNA(Gln) amidotransferase subunit GatE [Methanospirillum hungatei]MBP9007677.1 Glu-tRNA(Gln) amidotransferase subunit GatE [Methanospirillum sp.]HOW04587.1 Glu-tRNA(Gln) amidotransferase subunit GatE [Methanospirillum hungatei]